MHNYDKTNYIWTLNKICLEFIGNPVNIQLTEY